MKKGAAVLVALAAIVVSAMLAGSGAAKPNASSQTIAFIPPVIANPAIKALNDGIALKAKALGMNFETIGGQYSPQAQIVAMNAAIEKKVSMILIWPLDPKGIQPSFQKAKAAGIPILAIWSPGVPNVSANFQYNDGCGDRADREGHGRRAEEGRQAVQRRDHPGHPGGQHPERP